jgi:8-oxo-dGTP pyrophosphatase MutT (NUDIX family)
MARPPEIKKKISSGGIVFRIREGRTEVVIVAVRGRSWCLPKGIIDAGETPPETALREVREETGLTGEILDKIGQVSYWYFIKEEMIRVHKTVHFYLLKYLEGNTDDHDNEVDEALWIPIEEALDKLSYKSEKEIMRKAFVMIGRILESGTQ